MVLLIAQVLKAFLSWDKSSIVERATHQKHLNTHFKENLMKSGPDELHLTYPGITHLRFQGNVFDGHGRIRIPNTSKKTSMAVYKVIMGTIQNLGK